MELLKVLSLLAAVLPLAYGAPTQAMSGLHPDILAAMKRDLGLDAEQATARVTREISASEVIDHLRTSTGDKFAGAWVADDGKTISVGVTDEALSEEVTAAGAKPIVMVNSFNKLEEAKEALDKLVDAESLTKRDASTEGVASWYIDVESNKIVFEALAESTGNAEELASEVGLESSEFEVRTVEDMPTTYATIQGGDAYLINGASRCSVGFSVTTGFVSAGHCGRVGARATNTGGTLLGSFAGSSFPGNDMAFVRQSGGHTLRPYINPYGSGNLPVSGSTVAPIGSSVCRSGSTTGVYCGTIRNFGVTVNYAEGAVRGMTGTTVCAEPGDSGGSFYTGAQAQGVTSGGSGNCRTGGVTYFQPLNPILSAYGLTLVRA